jgi:hypothetical protein
MKKYFLLIALVMALVPALALAQTPCSPGYQGTELCNGLPTFGGQAVTDIPSFISAGLSWLATIIGTLALVMVLYSGAQMIFSNGDPTAVTKAKTTLTYAIYGLVLVMFAFVIVSGIQYFVGFNDQIQPGEARGGEFINPLRDANLMTFVQNSITNFLGFVGIIALGYIVFSGLRYMTAGGNEEQAKKARAGLQWAVIGLVCIIMSYVILTVVINTITGAAAE